MSRHIEDKGQDAAEPGVLLACFQEARHFSPGTRVRFGRLAARAALTGALGAGMAAAPAPGVRGASLGPGDPLRGEWSVIMVGPHFAAALVARDCGDDGPDADRRFDFVITHDRELVVRAAQPLLDRLLPAT
jgi:DICT domain-containing protein